MRAGSTIATGCFALLSVWRFTDGEVFWAVVFAALALANLVMALRAHPRQATEQQNGLRGRSAAGQTAPSKEQEELNHQHRRGWQVIAVVGLAAAVPAAIWFPPLALVLAACAAYSAYRARALGRSGRAEVRNSTSAKPSTH